MNIKKEQTYIPMRDKICLGQKNKNKVRIGLDMDGVVFNWITKCCETIGLDTSDPKIRAELKKGTRINKLQNISEKNMWDQINAAGTE